MPSRRPARSCARCASNADWKSQYCAAHKQERRDEHREYDRLREAARRTDPAVREHQRLAAVAYRQKYPERIQEANRRNRARPHYLRRTYGLTTDQFDALLVSQGGQCAICGRAPDLLHVDHDHATGKVRGLLCGQCNKALGLFGDEPERMHAAIAYLVGAR